MLNSPINFNDPTGHMCSDPEDPTPSCDGGGTPLPPLPDNDGGNSGESDSDKNGNNNDKQDLEEELALNNGGVPVSVPPTVNLVGGTIRNQQNGCTYHLCSVMNLYELGWENAGQAWSIVANPNASFGQRLGASAYLTGWVGFGHIGLVAGIGGLGCAAFVQGCTFVARPIFIQGFARGGAEWHVGLETVKNMNIIHIGKHITYGVHLAFGAIKPYAANLHIYLQEAFPFFRIWKP